MHALESIDKSGIGLSKQLVRSREQCCNHWDQGARTTAQRPSLSPSRRNNKNWLGGHGQYEDGSPEWHGLISWLLIPPSSISPPFSFACGRWISRLLIKVMGFSFPPRYDLCLMHLWSPLLRMMLGAFGLSHLSVVLGSVLTKIL
jgi:hypothetical protein